MDAPPAPDAEPGSVDAGQRADASPPPPDAMPPPPDATPPPPPDATPPPPDATPPPPDAAPPVVVELRVLPEKPVLSYSEPFQFQAIATYDDASTSDVTSLATWSATSGFTASPGGSVVSSTTGTGTVQADYGGLSDAVPVRGHFWVSWDLGTDAKYEVDFDGDNQGYLFAVWNGWVGALDYGVFANDLTPYPGVPTLLAEEIGNVDDVSAGMNNRGDRHVAWVWELGDDEQLEARHKLLDGAWEPNWVVQPLADTNVTAGWFRVCKAGRTYAALDGPRHFVPSTGWASKARAATEVDAFCNGASAWKDRWLSPVVTDAVYVAWFDWEFGDWTSTDEVFYKETPASEMFNLQAVDVGMDAYGNVIVAWVEEHSTYTRIVARRHTSATGWGPVVEVAREPVFNFPRIAVGPGGHAVLMWDSHPELRGAYFDPVDGWTPAMDIAATPGSDHYYSWDLKDEVVSVDNDGRGYVVYQEWIGSFQQLRVARYHPEHGWDSEVLDFVTSAGPETGFQHASIFGGLNGVAAVGYVFRLDWNETVYGVRFAE